MGLPGGASWRVGIGEHGGREAGRADREDLAVVGVPALLVKDEPLGQTGAALQFRELGGNIEQLQRVAVNSEQLHQRDKGRI